MCFVTLVSEHALNLIELFGGLGGRHHVVRFVLEYVVV